MKHPLALALAVALAATAPAYAQSEANAAVSDQAKPASSANPFFADSPLPLHYPQFDKISDADFGPAFDRGMADQLKEMEAIANDPAKPTFDNTVIAMEKSFFFHDTAATEAPAREHALELVLAAAQQFF